LTYFAISFIFNMILYIHVLTQILQYKQNVADFPLRASEACVVQIYKASSRQDSKGLQLCARNDYLSVASIFELNKFICKIFRIPTLCIAEENK